MVSGHPDYQKSRLLEQQLIEQLLDVLTKRVTRQPRFLYGDVVSIPPDQTKALIDFTGANAKKMRGNVYMHISLSTNMVLKFTMDGVVVIEKDADSLIEIGCQMDDTARYLKQPIIAWFPVAARPGTYKLWMFFDNIRADSFKIEAKNTYSGSTESGYVAIFYYVEE